MAMSSSGGADEEGLFVTRKQVASIMKGVETFAGDDEWKKFLDREPHQAKLGVKTKTGKAKLSKTSENAAASRSLPFAAFPRCRLHCFFAAGRSR